MTLNNPKIKEDPSSQQDDKHSAQDEDKDLHPVSSASTPDAPSFGWSAYAERVNGRFAMLGFISILIIEALSNSNFLQWAGFIPSP